MLNELTLANRLPSRWSKGLLTAPSYTSSRPRSVWRTAVAPAE